MTADYTPSQGLLDALQAFADFEEARTVAHDALRVAVAKELKEPLARDRKTGKPTEPTNKQVADVVPWSEETVRGIAREYGVKPKRAPTVKSIKPVRRSKPTN
jgi:hypothetical protein